MRQDCDVAIYLDLHGAMLAGVPFYVSENQVILTPGIRGKLSPRFIVRAINFRSGKVLFDREASGVGYLDLEMGTGSTTGARRDAKNVTCRRRANSDVRDAR